MWVRLMAILGLLTFALVIAVFFTGVTVAILGAYFAP